MCSMNIALAFGVNIHQCAEDSQLYFAIDRNDENLSIDALERCSATVNDWMLHNGLAINADKSEAIMFGTSPAFASSKIKSVTVAGSAFTISDNVKSLGVILDKCFTLARQVKTKCKAIHYHARSLHHIRRWLPDTLAKSIASSIVLY